MKKQLQTFILVILLLTSQIQTKPQQIEFQAQVGRLMDIIINSLYTQKQIFLRQLISNASDALDKIRFMSFSNPDILGSQTQLQIKIQYDADRKVVEIVDNGIGMTKDQLITNLGTIAKSGTTKFLQHQKAGDLNLIGQFGVGFYSSFLVAAKVEVISKSNQDSQHKWTSSASNIFTVQADDSINLKRGTMIRLYLKQDAYQFCEYQQLKKLISRYSSFINYPIYLQKIVNTQQKIQKTQAQIESQIQKAKQKAIQQGKDLTQQQLQKIQNSINRTTTRNVQTKKFQRINQNKPLWIRNKKQIKPQQYKQFYKNVFKETSDPLAWEHFHVQGDADFTGLIFIPERATYDQFQKFYQKKSQVKLYVRRVLVNDQFEDLLPKYLNFLKIIVDSDSLPLNVARQNLHSSKALQAIGKKLRAKAIDLLVSFNPQTEQEQELFSQEDDKQDGQYKSAYQRKVQTFDKFWKNFQKNIKLGIMQQPSQTKAKLGKISRWYTSRNISTLTSLDQIIGRMPQSQKDLYFLGGQDRAVIIKSPLIQRLKDQGYQVILGDDPLDQSIFKGFNTYEKKKIVNIAYSHFKQPFRTDQLRKQTKYLTKVFTPLIQYAKSKLQKQIKDVRVSMRLVNSPAVITADTYSDTPNMQRLQLATAMKQSYNKQDKNILQINPHSPIIQQLNRLVQQQPDQNTLKLVRNLFYSTLVHSGFVVKDPHFFSKSVFSLINTAFGVKQQIEDIVVSDEDLQTLEPPVTTTQTKTEEGISLDTEVNLDDSNVKIQNQQPKVEQQALQL